MAGAAMKGPDIGAGLTRMAQAIERGSAKTVDQSALAAKTIQAAQIARDSGGDMRLSGVGAAKGRGGNAKVGVRYKLEVRLGKPQAYIKATGPLHIINNDTAGHVIRSATARGRGRRGFVGPTLPGQFTGGGVLHFGNGEFARWARHPGTTGKGTWQKGRKSAEPVIRQSMSKRTFNIVKGAATL